MATMPTCQGSELTLDIITQSQAVISEHQGLIAHLRQRLGNPAIIIKTNLVATAEKASSSPFTSKQKLEVMLGENDHLKKMIEKFGLSFDY